MHHIATTHRNTDFDGLASIIAATILYPGTIAVCPKNVNPNVHRFLSLHKTSFDLVLTGEVDLAAVTRLIVTDTNQWRRLDKLDQLKNREDIEVLLWDHHLGIGGIERLHPAEKKGQRLFKTKQTRGIERLYQLIGIG